ncbi:MAG: PTS transporter subunit EIIC [Mycoplasmoidaceae bacterium]|nr:PTS transporter subunit EIIC [Mycoplasmoidaceae bacterium]
MYGYGAMGGSGATLMLPALCLLCCRSSQMKVTGKTAVLPILFQVNEPALFGVPTILNPIFAFPMIFTGMINDCLFKVFADTFSNSFHAGSLCLP